MGWWKLQDGSEMGDGPLDAAEEYLRSVSKEFEREFGHKPSLDVLLRPLALILENRADEFAKQCEEVSVSDITAKTKKRHRKRRLFVGDVFVIPIAPNKLAFGRLTPQRYFVEYFEVVSSEVLPLKQLFGYKTFRLPTMTSPDALEQWRWKVIGNVPYNDGEFSTQLFRMGGEVAVGKLSDKDGFIVTSEERRRATSQEIETIPELGISGEEVIIEHLRERLLKS